jgi:hypothetical protein
LVAREQKSQQSIPDQQEALSRVVERLLKHDVKRSTHHGDCPRVLHSQRKISDTLKSGVAERNLCYS